VKIYTRTGDRGDTGLIGGARTGKDNPRIAAIGDVDELNAALGVARTLASDSDLDETLMRIQCWLFDLGAELASPEGGRMRVETLTGAETVALEESIDDQTAALPPLRNFILPGGSPLAAQLHYCRGVCRRAERSVVALSRTERQREETLVFLNRLSDWLFVSARTANRVSGVSDLEWKRQEA
jgi:cob(I)alamin adenosyltransferase